MANTKISDLPASTTMSETDVFPVTQTSTTRKATLAQVRGMVSMTDYVTGDGSDEHAAIQAFFDAAVNKIAIIPPPVTAYGLGSTGIVLLPGRYKIIGAGRDVAAFTYSGTGKAIDGTTNAGVRGSIEGISITCSNDAATGVSFGNATQAVRFSYNAIYGSDGAGNTGTGLLLDANAIADTFSGQAEISMNLIQGFKYGIRATGGASSRTWTTVGGYGNYLIGRSAGVIANSRGILFEATTNGVGSVFTGGTIESFARPIGILGLPGGFVYCGDIEGNTSNVPDITTGADVDIRDTMGFVRAIGNNGATNIWWEDYRLSGNWYTQSYYNRTHNVPEGSSDVLRWGLTRGVSEIDGGTPTDKFVVVHGGTGDIVPEDNYFKLLSNKMSWYSAAPTAGTWARGDVVWNTGASAGGSPGWVCTTAGTPGTWKTMPNVGA